MATAMNRSAICSLVLFVLLSLLQLSVAIRITDVSANARANANVDTNVIANVDTNVNRGPGFYSNASEECIDGLRSLWRTVSYREVFRPIFEGTYRIRNRYSGKYLTGSPDGHLGTSMHHVSTSKMSDWKLNRVEEPGLYAFTLENRMSGNFLAAQGGEIITQNNQYQVTEAGRWRMVLTEDGVHYTIRSIASTEQVIMENRTSFVELADRSALAGRDDDMKSQWVLENQLSWIRWPQGDEAGYKAQWAAASDLPLFAGTDLTWKKVCEETQIDCSTGYAKSRTAYKNLGMLAETHRRIVTETLLKGSCDTEWAMIKYMFSGALVLEEVRSTVGQACAGHSLSSIGTHLKEAVIAECFGGCLQSIREYTEETEMPCQKPDNITEVFLGILAKKQCDDVQASAIQKMGEWVMFERCMTWYAPDPLWTADFQAQNSLRTAEGTPACSIPVGKESSRKSVDILQAGVCPTGTSCQCPSMAFEQMKTVSELKAGMDIFVEDDSTLNEILYDQLSSQGRRVLMNIFLRGVNPLVAITAVPSTFTLVRNAWSVGNWAAAGLQWRCRQTVACWPDWPEQKESAWTSEGTDYSNKKACRLPAEAKSGGSPVWFLPPPGVKTQRRAWYRLRKCEFAPCEMLDMIRQTVGFGPSSKDKAHVYNCQPLPFEDMTESQKSTYIREVRETIPSEYVDEI